MPIDWTSLIQQGAQIAGQAAAGRAAGRAQESTTLNQRDNTANSLYGTAQNAQMQAAQLDLQRRAFAEQAAGNRAKQATVGDLLSRLQDVSINVPGIKTANISGGLRPSAMGDVGRTSNSILAKQALMKQLEGDQFQGGQILQAPQQSAMPQANALDKILSGAGLGGSFAGAAMGARTPGQATPVGAVPTDAPVGETSSYVPKVGSQLQGLDPQLLQYLLGQQQTEGMY